MSGSFTGTVGKSSGISKCDSFANSNAKGNFYLQCNRKSNLIISNSLSVNNFGQLTNSSHSMSTPSSGTMDGRRVEDDVHLNLPGMIVAKFRIHVSGLGRVGGEANDGYYERHMLESLCESAGLKTL